MTWGTNEDNCANCYCHCLANTNQHRGEKTWGTNEESSSSLGLKKFMR